MFPLSVPGRRVLVDSRSFSGGLIRDTQSAFSLEVSLDETEIDF